MTPSPFIAWAASLEVMDYYEMLRVRRDASPSEIQSAFHALSLNCHPDRFVNERADVARAASTVFKRLAEAYSVLRRAPVRARYDAALAKQVGAANATVAHFDEHAVAARPTFAQRTLSMIARSPRAKQHAAKADRFLSNGQLEEARIQIISAYQHDPGNDELKERLDILYEALSLEPP